MFTQLLIGTKTEITKKGNELSSPGIFAISCSGGNSKNKDKLNISLLNGAKFGTYRLKHSGAWAFAGGVSYALLAVCTYDHFEDNKDAICDLIIDTNDDHTILWESEKTGNVAKRHIDDESVSFELTMRDNSRIYTFSKTAIIDAIKKMRTHFDINEMQAHFDEIHKEYEKQTGIRTIKTTSRPAFSL